MMFHIPQLKVYHSDLGKNCVMDKNNSIFKTKCDTPGRNRINGAVRSKIKCMRYSKTKRNSNWQE